VGHGTLLAGRYRLEERVRAGADGSTWRAVDENRDRQVVIRLLRPGHPHAAAVVDAARRVALVEDQRLARVLGVADGSLVYVVSEHVPGKELASLVSPVPLPGETVRRIIGEAAQALDRAHARGLHHLQLSPRSIAVDRDGAVKVLGLGIDAAAAGIEPDERAGRTDAVDLVKLLYAGLTGRWPGETTEGLEQAPRVAGRAVPPGDLNTGVPNDLDALCESALAHDDGPLSPGELAAALSPWADAAPLGGPGGLAAAGPSRPIPVIRLPQTDPELEPEPEPDEWATPTLLPRDEPVGTDADEAPGEPTDERPAGGERGHWWAGPLPGVPIRESAWTARLEEAFADGAPVVERVDLTALQTPAYPVVRAQTSTIGAAEPTGTEAGPAGPLPPDAGRPAAEDLDGPELDGPDLDGPDGDGPDGGQADPPGEATTGEPGAAPEPAPQRPEPPGPAEPVPAAPQPDPQPEPAGRAPATSPDRELSPAAVAAAAAVVRAPNDIPVYGFDPDPEPPDGFARFFGTTRLDHAGSALADVPLRSEAGGQTALDDRPPGQAEGVGEQPDGAIAGADPDRAGPEDGAGPRDELPWAGIGHPVAEEEPIGPFGPLLVTAPPDRDQTRMVLIVVGVVVLIGLVFALNGLKMPGFNLIGDDAPSVPIPNVSAPPVTSGPLTGSRTSGGTPAGDPFKISKVQPLDPQGDGDENDSRAKRAADGDEDTVWASKTYRSAQFGGLKDGLGLGLQLRTETEVHQVVVHFDGSGAGAKLQLRTAGGLSFDGSTVIASTTVDGGTATLTVNSPVRTRDLVLWCTQLPETGNGFRLQVSEVEVR
jgi:hypothetical protein